MLDNIKNYWRLFKWAGLTSAIKAKLLGKPALCKVTRPNCQYPFYLRIPSSDVPAYTQVFVNREYLFRALSIPRVIVDAGANIGLASIYFANQYPEATIIAVEPEKENFELLVRNTSQYPNVIPVQAALWHRDENIDVTDPGLGQWGYMVEESGKSIESVAVRHSVRAVTVKSLMQAYKLETIDILKIDIEGAEKEVFTDTSGWIHQVKSIIIELHEHLREGASASFYEGACGFNHQWRLGENVYYSKDGAIAPS